MNENDESNGSNKLKDLVNQYQEQRAPVGFAERVAARAKETKRGKAYSPYRLPFPPGIGVTIGVALVLIVSTTVVVVSLTPETPEDLQLAQQDPGSEIQIDIDTQVIKQPGFEIDSSVQEQATIADNTAAQTEQNPNQPTKQVQEDVQVELATLPSPQDAGFANVAVLSDLSSWLDESQDEKSGELYAADFFDMPDLADLDAMSDMS